MKSNITTNQFVFSPHYRVPRHLLYWTVYSFIWGGFWTLSMNTYWYNVFITVLWIPVKILYCYPFMYFIIPNVLFKEKYKVFALIVVAWGIAGWYLNYAFQAFAFLPFLELVYGHDITGNPWNVATYLCLTTAAAGTTIIKVSKYWIEKQQAWLRNEKEKVTAELQLLKAQLHPHFLFNTLNNIYSFALQNSDKTSQMILKLSSLLSYMLYQCKTDEVSLEKEVEVMKNYMDLEKERYGDKLDLSVNIEGDIQDKFITPLLILPFLENAFKHGTSEQLEKPWMSVDIAVKDFLLKCKVVNSKNEFIPFHESGVGIANVKKRLELLYPGSYELKLADEGEFFVVSLLLDLKSHSATPVIPLQKIPASIYSYEDSVFANR